MEVSRRSFLAGAAASGFAGFAAPDFATPTLAFCARHPNGT